MILARTVDYRTPLQTILYTPAYREQYARMHSTDVYWTADKILAAPEHFRVILALDGQKVVGYLDVTYCFEENEPYDIFVLPGYRNRGYAKAMLARTVALNLSIPFPRAGRLPCRPDRLPPARPIWHETMPLRAASTPAFAAV